MDGSVSLGGGLQFSHPTDYQKSKADVQKSQPSGSKPGELIRLIEEEFSWGSPNWDTVIGAVFDLKEMGYAVDVDQFLKSDVFESAGDSEVGALLQEMSGVNQDEGVISGGRKLYGDQHVVIYGRSEDAVEEGVPDSGFLDSCDSEGGEFEQFFRELPVLYQRKLAAHLLDSKISEDLGGFPRQWMAEAFGALIRDFLRGPDVCSMSVDARDRLKGFLDDIDRDVARIKVFDGAAEAYRIDADLSRADAVVEEQALAEYDRIRDLKPGESWSSEAGWRDVSGESDDGSSHVSHSTRLFFERTTQNGEDGFLVRVFDPSYPDEGTMGFVPYQKFDEGGLSVLSAVFNAMVYSVDGNSSIGDILGSYISDLGLVGYEGPVSESSPQSGGYCTAISKLHLLKGLLGDEMSVLERSFGDALWNVLDDKDDGFSFFRQELKMLASSLNGVSLGGRFGGYSPESEVF